MKHITERHIKDAFNTLAAQKDMGLVTFPKPLVRKVAKAYDHLLEGIDKGILSESGLMKRYGVSSKEAAVAELAKELISDYIETTADDKEDAAVKVQVTKRTIDALHQAITAPKP